jgi:hypothetical protein
MDKNKKFFKVLIFLFYLKMSSFEEFYNKVENKKNKESVSYEPFVGEFLSSFQNISLPIRYRDGILIKSIHPDKIPVIIDRGSQETPKLKKNKFLISKDKTLGELIIILKKFIITNDSRFNEKQAIFLFINGNIYSSSKTVNEIYETVKPDDLYLKIIYSVENCFGVSY